MTTFQSRSIFKNTYRSDIMRIIIICASLFVGLGLVRMIFNLSEEGTAFFIKYLEQPLYLPNSFAQFIRKPWSILTFGFIDQNFWMLLGHMIWLWIFGSVIEDLTGTNRVLPIFLLGSIMGGFLFLLGSAFFALPSLYAGTLGGVTAVVAAAVRFKPKYIFYAIFNRGIPLYAFAIVFLLLTILLKLNDVSTLLFFVGGAIIGLLHDSVLSGFFDYLHVKLGNLRAYFSSNDNFIKSGKNYSTRNLNTSEKSKDRVDRLNEILDKINKDGLESLSAKEKLFLEQYS